MLLAGDTIRRIECTCDEDKVSRTLPPPRSPLPDSPRCALRSSHHSSGARSHAQDAGISADGRRGPYWNEQGATCIACNIGVTSPGFATPSEQRAHFKTDWHRFNVKRRLNKQPALSEDNFERLLEEAAEVRRTARQAQRGEGPSCLETGIRAGLSCAARAVTQSLRLCWPPYLARALLEPLFCA